jgi:hypothetical protein
LYETLLGLPASEFSRSGIAQRVNGRVFAKKPLDACLRQLSATIAKGTGTVEFLCESYSKASSEAEADG